MPCATPAITLQCRINKSFRWDRGDNAPAEVINTIIEVGRSRIAEDFAKSVVIISQQRGVNIGTTLIDCRPLVARDTSSTNGQAIAAFYTVKKSIGKMWFHEAIAACTSATVKLRQLG